MIEELASYSVASERGPLSGRDKMYHQVNNSEQLRELSSNDLNFLENVDSIVEVEGQENSDNSTVRDLDNILDKFEADTQLLLENPNQLLNCK